MAAAAPAAAPAAAGDGKAAAATAGAAAVKCRSCSQCPGFAANPFKRARCRECSHDAAEHEGLTDADQAAAQLSKDDSKPSEIIAGVLYMGGLQAALNDGALKAAGVTHVVCCAKDLHKFLPNFKPNKTDFAYLQLQWQDDAAQDLCGGMAQAQAFIDAAVAKGGAAFVHCAQGVSRSGAVVVAYVMRTRKLSYAQGLAFVKARRICVQPNSGFEQQLKAMVNGMPGGGSVAAAAADNPSARASGQ